MCVGGGCMCVGVFLEMVCNNRWNTIALFTIMEKIMDTFIFDL